MLNAKRKEHVLEVQALVARQNADIDRLKVSLVLAVLVVLRWGR